MGLRITSSFAAKLLMTIALAALGDSLFWIGGGFGSSLGIFALLWLGAALLLTRPAWHNRKSWVAAGSALSLAAILFAGPSLLALVLYWCALTMMVLLPRLPRFDHAGRWMLRLIVHGIASVVAPWRDLLRVRKHVRGRAQLRRMLPLLPLPIIGGAIFLALFASANPLIAEALLQVGLPEIGILSIFRGIFWMLLFTIVWAALRPRHKLIDVGQGSAEPMLAIPGVSVGSVTLALLTFNLLFAVQNGLDLAFLWSGTPLPGGVTLADYAHRGAYPLILTALLAGIFVLVALRPGSPTAAAPAIRRMVVIWIAQNVLLVASTMLRTTDYIEVYSLTRLRIAALVWMALVAVGLMLIVWRMMRARSAAWLINANAFAALLVLGTCSVVDLGSIAAAWNVRHAGEVGGKGAALDLCYLNALGPSALVSLVRLEQRGGLSPDFAARVRWVRHQVLDETLTQQGGGWWTWRNARRLSEIQSVLGGTKRYAQDNGPDARACDGSLLPPPPPSEPPSPPPPVPPGPALTNEVAG